MPLETGSSKEAIQANIQKLIDEGYEPDQAAAIAHSKAETDTARVIDDNGWFEVEENPLSKTGVFEYLGKSIGAPEPNKIYRVYRPPEELSSEETIRSFRLVPFVDEHEMLGDEERGFTPAERKGVHGVVGEKVRFEDGRIIGNIKVFSERLANLINSGKKQLSLGYRCLYDFTGGVIDGVRYDCIQRNIRGNHLALVEEGRMGPDVAVMDENDFVLTMDSVELDMSEEAKPEEQKDESQTQDEEMTLSEVTSTLKTLMPKIAEIQKMMESMKAPESEEAEVEEKEYDEEKPSPEEDEEKEEESVTVKAMDKALEKIDQRVSTIDANVVKYLAKRDKLANQLSGIVGSFDHSEMSLDEVVDYGCQKLELECAEDEKTAVLAGYLQGHKPEQAIVAQDSAPVPDAIREYMKEDK